MLVYEVIFPNAKSTQYDSVRIHTYTKVVWYICLLGHIARISLHLYGVEICDVIQLLWSLRLLAPTKHGSARVER
jgi:hypothetical protein